MIKNVFKILVILISLSLIYSSCVKIDRYYEHSFGPATFTDVATIAVDSETFYEYYIVFNFSANTVNYQCCKKEIKILPPEQKALANLILAQSTYCLVKVTLENEALLCSDYFLSLVKTWNTYPKAKTANKYFVIFNNEDCLCTWDLLEKINNHIPKSYF
jgi:hypothetical protein